MAHKGKIMAHTDKLLSLADQFPQAFADVMKSSTSPEAETSSQVSQEAGAPTSKAAGEDQHSAFNHDSDSSEKIGTEHTTDSEKASPFKQSTLQSGSLSPQFLALMQEFPQAFADTSEDAQRSSDDNASSVAAAASTVQATDSDNSNATEAVSAASSSAAVASPISFLPSGDYDQALQRHISTFTWGKVQIFFTYGQQGLRSIWVTVGKSGTEVQSLCEAISRLINLLLEQQVPTPEICRQIRGIRGADSEGLGPNRILGLADLIGKALHEAPESLSPASVADASGATPHASTLETGAIASASGSAKLNGSSDPQKAAPTENAASGTSSTVLPAASTVEAVQTTAAWTIPEAGDLTAMLCPECGAELHHMNGCSGGACPVCGYSSCS